MAHDVEEVMNGKFLSGAILIETVFAQWCGENYDTLHKKKGVRVAFLLDKRNADAIDFAILNY